MKVLGISRIADNERAILLLTRERPTDDDMRDFHDWNRDFRSMQRKYAELQERVNVLEADAECFRIWVSEVERSTISLAKAIAHCVTEDDYRKVLLGIRDAGSAAIQAMKEGKHV